MTYTIGNLTDDVMERLGENVRPLASSVTAMAGISVRERVEKRVATMLPEAGSAVILEAEPHTLIGGESMASSLTMEMLPCGLYGAEIIVPDDFLRLSSIKMEGWRRSMSATIAPGSMEMLWSKESGIAGCPSRPKVYMMIKSGRLRLIAVGSASRDDRLEHCLIWRVPKADEEGRFRFPEGVYANLVGRIAEQLE